MRRPTHPRHTATAWARPYSGLASMFVCYADGGDPERSVPKPSDLAEQKNVVVELRDPETGLAMTQERFTVNMTKARRSGRHAVIREIAEAAGLDVDIDSFDTKRFGTLLKEAETARKEKLSEEQRRAEELNQERQQLEDMRAQLEQRAQEAARRERETTVRAALVQHGATGDDLADAAALLRVNDDADETQIAEAAEALKVRRPELFGVRAQPKTLPAAPSGGPAGGPPRAPAAKDDIKARALARAQQMGYAKPDAA
ncbi:hypothetical protein ACPCDX_29260 [Streptomyces koyangensis]|uniref:phage scaffolding protein n=1 Tax=Streptomyces koyangensis TaxID=188770 RepID=UPI003C2ABBE8